MVLNELLFAVLHAAHRRIILYHLSHQGSPGNVLILSFKKKKQIYSFIWLHQILVVACGIFELRFGMQDLSCSILTLSCGMWDLVP